MLRENQEPRLLAGFAELKPFMRNLDFIEHDKYSG